jgi:DNA-binding PadR family transcriptional regulator
VLLQLVGEPMHVYRMQKLFEAQGKDRVVNVRSPASLYQTVRRLEQHGLIEVRETRREGKQPDRTVYGITYAGREAAREWLQEMLVETGAEYPEFIAALSMVFTLAPDQVLPLLEERTERLTAELNEAEDMLSADPDLPRLFLLEEEYRAALLRAEIEWLRSVIDDLASGRLDWDEEWIRQVGEEFNPDD